MKITLLGDSIRMLGYGKLVPELLGWGYEVYQPEDNCRFAKYTLRGLFDWEGQMSGSRIIHWNNGLWDVCNLFGDGSFSTENEYITNMLHIADVLLSKYEKVIFATMIPVSESSSFEEKTFIENLFVERYNQIIEPLLLKKGIVRLLLYFYLIIIFSSIHHP